MKIQADNIPEELKKKKQWCCWKYVYRDGKKKPTKPPCDLSGSVAPHIEVSAKFRKAFAVANNKKSIVDGIGFSLREEDKFCGIDIDNCIDSDGNISDYAMGVVKACNSYTEISPSGKGLRIFGYGKPDTIKVPAIEVYTKDRYLTVTGNVLEGYAVALRKIKKPANKFIKAIRGKKKSAREGKQAPISQGKDEKVYKNLLKGLSPSCDYYTWLEICQGLHDHFGGSSFGEDIFVAWSSGSYGNKKYKGFDEEECREKWQSIKGNKKNGEKVTIGSIFKRVGRDKERAFKKATSPNVNLKVSKKKAKGLFSSHIEDFRERAVAKAKWAYPKLIHEGAIVTVVAPGGTGKTGVFYYHVCTEIAKRGYKINYLNADDPIKEFRAMEKFAKKNGMSAVNPEFGDGIGGCIEELREATYGGFDLTKQIFVFDTLKKFTDLMSKEATKDFYNLCKSICDLGGTVILLAHTNKYPDQSGNWTFDGVGDIRNDTTDMLYLYGYKCKKKHIVSIYVDKNKSGVAENEFTFQLERERREDPVRLDEFVETRAMMFLPDEEEIYNVAIKLINENGKSAQGQLINTIVTDTGFGKNKIHRTLCRLADKPYTELKRVRGDKNSWVYMLKKANLVITE